MNIHADCGALWARHATKGNETANNQKKEATDERKSSRFDRLVARYYPAVLQLRFSTNR